MFVKSHLHHLPILIHDKHSQSQRILWLLEELEIDYDVVLYERQKGRAPPELKKIHSQGKSPVLVTAEGRTIAESSAIATYLLRTYDKSGRFGGGPNETADWVRDEELCSFGATSLGCLTIMNYIFWIIGHKTPWILKPFVSPFTIGINNYALGPVICSAVEHLENELGDGPYFMGTNPGRADFVISYPMDQVAAANMADLEKDFPKLAAWRKRCTSRPAWIRALEKGNGYDWVNGI